MKFSAFASLVLGIVLLANATGGFSFETDQYNLPPEPLFDIGDEVTDYVLENLMIAVNKLNADIAHSKKCVDIVAAGAKCGSVRSESDKLTYLRSNDAVANAVYNTLGSGNLFITTTGKWFRKHKFSHEPSHYKTGYTESIFIVMPIDYLSLSPTVKLYGVEFGTDKVEHFFQQGYKYYTTYNEAIAKGQTPQEAAKKAVQWGQRTERTYFGLLVSGVYSNGDLYANYAGMRFYQGLTQPVRIGSSTRPAILVLKDGSWKINDEATLRKTLIKPFISDHLNEAYNPSSYSFILFPSVRRIVRKQSCPQWKQRYPRLTAAEINARSAALTLWNGEDYGYTKKDRMVTIGETCFEQKH